MTRWCWLLLGCLLPAMAMAEDKLGRLFFTPAERASLESLRQNSRAPMVNSIAETEKEGEEEMPAVTPSVGVDGFVKRSDGKSTVWINGRPVDEKTAPGNVELGKLRRDSNRVPIRLPNSGQVIELKPGQVYDPASGKVTDGLSERLTGETQPNKASAVKQPAAAKSDVADAPPESRD